MNLTSLSLSLHSHNNGRLKKRSNERVQEQSILHITLPIKIAAVEMAAISLVSLDKYKPVYIYVLQKLTLYETLSR